MRCHCWTAVLCSFALLSGAPAAAPLSAQVSAGQIALGAAQQGGVALAIDLDALAQGLCTGNGRPILRASAECSLTADNYPFEDKRARRGIGLKASEAHADGEGRITVVVTPNALELAGTGLLRTPCGLWQYSLLLDPAADQAAAPLTLHPAAKPAAEGMFAGVIEVAAVLHLVPLDAHGHPDESDAIDLPFDFTLQLAGAWATAPAPLPGAADSNLLLFAGFAGGKWLSRPGCEWTTFDGVWCESCVEVESEVLEGFNAMF